MSVKQEDHDMCCNIFVVVFGVGIIFNNYEYVCPFGK